MASGRSSPYDHPKRQSIPLQDLSSPAEYDPESPGGWRSERAPRRRSRSLLGNRQSFSGRVNTSYERIDEDSPPAQEGNNSGLPHVTTPRNAHQPPVPFEDGELSPVNVQNFQAAMGSVGLSFDTPGPSRAPPGQRRSTLNVITEHENMSASSLPFHHAEEPEPDHYFSPQDTDTTPLTDTRFLQPMDGAPSPNEGLRAPPLSTGHSRSNSRLGDGLHRMETGLGRPLSSLSARSLGPASSSNPLSRAGTILRKTSQRVVNLSNEPDTMEHELRRQRSAREARMEGPPALPAMQDYAHDERPSPPPEKAGPTISEGRFQSRPNPLKGNSLGLFSPDNWLRRRLCEMLVHPITEPIILILIVIQTILLAVDSAPEVNYKDNQKPKAWSASWINFGLLGLFIIYTLEIIARIIVSGFIKNADEYSTVDTTLGFTAALNDRVRTFFGPQTQNPSRKTTNESRLQPSILRSFTGMQVQLDSDQPGHSRQQQRIRLARRAFLRHGFNRLDFVAVVSFWITFVLANIMVEQNHHLYIFRMLSALRILRLLGLTQGTSVILRSLKKAAPMLANVAFLIGFFWLLFAIIGVQCFKASLRRTCIWYENATDVLNNHDLRFEMQSYNRNDPENIVQFCGGHLHPATGLPMPWLRENLQPRPTKKHKGYLCPQNSLCVEGGGPYNGTVSFDNVLQSLELVFVIMSANTFSNLLYYTTDSDFLAAALFFAFGIVIMSLWLMNLLVAVITSSFQVIREESKTSAFTVDPQDHFIKDEDEIQKVSRLKRLFDKTNWIWILIIVYDLFVMCLRSASMSNHRKAFISKSETVVTILLAVEIVLRFISDWRNFHKSTRNWIDLTLAIITAIIQIPPIHQSGQTYEWLTFFQIIRIYRVVLAVSLTRELIKKVLGNVSGLLNLIVFVFLITFLTAIFAVQIFRGEFKAEDAQGDMIHVTFSDIYNAFIGMYQVLSSENWTTLLYNSTQAEYQWGQAWIGATFFVLWFILANFIVLNMFIAVIQENFDVSEDEKRLQQVKAFLQQKELGGSSHGNLSLATIFKLGRDKSRHKDPLDFGPATMEMLLQEAVFRDFLDEHMEPMEELHEDDDPITGRPTSQVNPGLLSTWWGKLVRFVGDREPNPFYSRLQFSRANEEVDIRTRAREVVSAAEQRKRAQRQYLQRHPRYNVSLFVFGPRNILRRFCQRIVGPGRGNTRFEGVDPVRPVWYAFSALIYAAIVAMVLLACVSTPLYQRDYFKHNGFSSRNWFVWTDMGFAVIFSIEALIKVIADGFFWTPNAYFRGSWGLIDGLVLVTLWINVITSLYSDGAVSRVVGAFKALRALRLLNVSDSARDTFHSVIVLGGWKVISAAFVSLSLLFPFAIYGLNLFNGQMRTCNDRSVDLLNNCVGEFKNKPFNWEVLSPRRAANPYYSFDNFGNSLSILFQIVSQEGWTDVMWSAMGAAGVGNQPKDKNSQGNAVFFIIFNLLGAVFVLTLFVSVFMRNYTEQTGVAFLTADQRSWLELRKLLRQISPSKRPSSKADKGFRGFCYRIAVKKHGRWQRLLTTVLFFHLVLLVLEWYPEPDLWKRLRDYIFLTFTVFYIANVVVRVVGLTWKRFRKSSWDLYSVLSITGTVVTTLLDLSRYNTNGLYAQLHKLFLVSIALLLIPRNNQLDQLFKTAAASLTAIGNLLATWFVLFLVYAIALTQTFGLTRFGINETGNINFRNVPKALILLFRMSMGEGWNAIMEDFATITSPNCVDADQFYDSDCGHATWARILFMSWNILSMYIFVSMFVSLIFESFSYVYQRSSGLSVINRKEIRRFKQAWATFDPEGTGFIAKDVFPRLLGELSGVFEMRIYAGSDHSVNRILENCRVEVRGNETPPPGVVHGIDIDRLNDQLREINISDIRRRRHKMEIFYQEVMVSAHPDRGINFTSCLMILAHYNVILDSKSLRLEEYLRRRARLQRVEEEVRRRVVKGFFDMMFWSRSFRSRLDFRHSARMVNIPQFAVPEIFVDDQDADIDVSPQSDSFPPSVPPKDSSPSGSRGRPSLDVDRRPSVDAGGLRHRGDSVSRSPSRSPQGSVSHISPQLSPRHPGHSPSYSGDSAFQWEYDGTTDNASPVGGLSPAGGRSRAGSSVNRQDVLDVFDNSAWGESMRRSFTLSRRANRGRGSRRGRGEHD